MPAGHHRRHVGLIDGVRESAQSWRELLLEARLCPAPSVCGPSGSDHRFGKGGRHWSNEFFVELFSNQVKPRFGASRAIVEVFNLRLQLIYPIFGGSKITR